jgi:hypothetical protein
MAEEAQKSGSVWGRVLAALAAVPLGFCALVLFWLASIWSQSASREEWAAHNSLQLILGWSGTLALGAAGVLAVVHAASGRSGRVLLLMILIAAVLVGLWILGLRTWCSGCGVP